MGGWLRHSKPQGASLFDGPAELPRVYVDTTYPTSFGTPGTPLTVGTGKTYATIQSAIDAVVNTNNFDGSTNWKIIIDADVSNANVILKAKTGASASGTGWIVLESANIASLPAAGIRVAPSYVSHMPEITSTTTDNPLVTENFVGTHHYRLVGLEISHGLSSSLGYTCAAIGIGSEDAESELCHHVIFDRCYVHGHATKGVRKCIALNGNHLAVIDSYVADAKSVLADSFTDTNAIWILAGYGPFKIVNNYLSAAGINFFTGGAQVYIAGMVPSDIEIRRNHCYKPVAWRRYDKDGNEISQPPYGGVDYQVKNLFELKFGFRVLLEGNLFDQHWTDVQDAFCLVLTPRAEGVMDWVGIRDMVVRYNLFRHIPAWLSLSGGDGTTLQTQRLRFHDNLIYDLTNIWSAPGDAKGQVCQGGNGFADVTIDYNTAVYPFHSVIYFNDIDPKCSGFIFRNNILQHGDYGVLADGSGQGSTALAGACSDRIFTSNVLIKNGATPPDYSGDPGNDFPATTADVKFVDAGNDDYHLAGDSPYPGKGADIDAVETYTAHCIDGDWS